MSMRRIIAVLTLALLAGCMDAPLGSGINGPTGRASDTGKITVVRVRPVWMYDLKKRSQDMVVRKLPYGQTARFDDAHFEGFYDATLNVTRVSVFGNVSSASDYGTTYNNGYYVTWEQEGRVSGDDLPPWRIVDVVVLDQTY